MLLRASIFQLSESVLSSSSAKGRGLNIPFSKPFIFFNHSINLGKLFQSFAVSDKSHNIQVLLT